MANKKKTDWAHSSCRFRIRYHFRRWRGKPDPLGHSMLYLYSDDPSWLHEEAQKLQLQGHWGIVIERREDAELG